VNQLYYGDNLVVLREHIANESVHLIYLDPPFNSKRDYNLLFKSPKGVTSDAQIEAFEDTWHWNEQAEREFDELLHQSNTSVSDMMRALRSFLGENDMMAYLTMMANRLLELHRVLKPTGSLYLHCDPTASHYLKVVLDGVFGKENFRNEIIWKRTTAHSSANKFAPIHDTIFYYAKGDQPEWNNVRLDYTQDYLEKYYRFDDGDGRLYWRADLCAAGVRHGSSGKLWRGRDVTAKGMHWKFAVETLEKLDKQGRIYWPPKGGWPQYKRYRDELKGLAVSDLWDDVNRINPVGGERLGYPTQKPLALLERIISASSNEGDMVLDPFCGCGTAVDAAQKLKRKWIGIDITHLAISLIEKRLKDRYGARCKFEVHGTPKDVDAARDLARRDKYQFQWWAVSLVEAQPFQGKKKGADTGIDGLKFFRDLDRKDVHKVVVSVKGGGIKPDDVRAINSVREREKADIALFISLEAPTRAMVSDAAAAGVYASHTGKKYPRVQLLTISDLLSGNGRAEHPDYEPDLNFKKASAARLGEQENLL
jgi:DNA modification methylase